MWPEKTQCGKVKETNRKHRDKTGKNLFKATIIYQEFYKHAQDNGGLIDIMQLQEAASKVLKYKELPTINRILAALPDDFRSEIIAYPVINKEERAAISEAINYLQGDEPIGLGNNSDILLQNICGHLTEKNLMIPEVSHILFYLPKKLKHRITKTEDPYTTLIRELKKTIKPVNLGGPNPTAIETPNY
ncbi:MAG: hypothetical protein KAT91_01095 [Candidatus Aenigmarchaeota archaeon]|nr:hypothetical protein [Candidatus Aenigmarchaeota archaeon]